MKLDKGEYWDKSLSPVIGCSPCSLGCLNCWARRIVERFMKSHRALGFGDVQTKIGVMHQLKRKKPTIYALSWLGDLFHKDVRYEFIRDVFHAMLACPRHTFLVLTKRGIRMKSFVDEMHSLWGGKGAFPKNVWFGITVCNQEELDRYLPVLASMRVVHRWLSVEPMLSPIEAKLELYRDKLDWVVVGSESGSSARKASPDWIRSIVAQCDAAGVPCFVKQIHDENGKLVKAPWGFPLELPPELCRRDSK